MRSLRQKTASSPRKRNSNKTRSDPESFAIVNLLGSMNLTMVFLDRELRVRQFLPAAENVLNLTASDIGQPLAQLRLNMDIPDLDRLLAYSTRHAKVTKKEIQDRQGRWYFLQIRPYITAEKKIEGVVLALVGIHDLAEKMHQLADSSQRLRMAEEKFRNLVEAAPDAMVIIDTKGTIKLANKQAERMFGYKKAELEGQPHQILIPVPFRKLHAANRAAYLKDPKARPMGSGSEIFAIRKDGGRVPVEINLSPVPTPEGLEISAGIRDVSEREQRTRELRKEIADRKRAEEESRASQAALETALASTTDAVFITDAQGRFVHVNDAFATYHRFRNKEECSKSIAECPDILAAFLPDGTEAPLDMWAVPRALRGERVTNTIYTLRRKDTGETWVGGYSFGPIRSQDGAIVGAVVVARDITDLKRFEEQSKEAAVLAERNRLARDVHDNLAQGLTGIVLQLEGSEEILRKDPEGAKKHIVRARDLARKSLQEARRSLLAIRPSEAGNPLLPEDIEQTIRDLRRETTVNIEVSVKGSPVPLPPDVRESLLRITQEALYNAIRHGSPSRIRVELGYHKETINLRIQDNGQGFSPNAKPKQDGMGLSIMRERAAEMGGKCTIRTKPGKGTRVEVLVPLAGFPRRKP